MSEKCLQCFRKKQNCLCKYIKKIDPCIKFVFLMHPHEAYRERTGTGRLTHLSLERSEIVIDTTFDNNKRVQELLGCGKYYAMILYPGEDANFTESLNFNKDMSGKQLLVFLIDATWTMAKKMMYRSLTLQKIPKISFNKEYSSEFTFKKQPERFCLSTIESTYYLIKELQEAGISRSCEDPKGLLDVFYKMVNFQLDCENKYSQSN